MRYDVNVFFEEKLTQNRAISVNLLRQLIQKPHDKSVLSFDINNYKNVFSIFKLKYSDVHSM